MFPLVSFARRILVAPLLAILTTAATAEIQHVIAISVDGLRGDFLQMFVTSSPAEFPNFVRLRDTGAFTFNARCDYDYSETVPNHITMVTGRPVAQPVGLVNTWHHGFSSNFPNPTDTIHASGNPAVPYKTSIFDVAHDRGLSTALYLGKTRLTIIDRSYNATNGALDLIGTDNGRDKIDFAQIQDGNTGTLVSTLTTHISGTLERFTFLHVTDPDTAGHMSGWSNAAGSPYRNSIKTVDGYLGLIFAALDARPALQGRVAVLLTGDHGGGGGTLTNHTDATRPENYTIPFFLVAPGIAPGSNLYGAFENRFEPGATRPTYAAPEQPVRNGDLGNLSAALLGLPLIPGAYMTPELRRSLVIQPSGSQVEVSWPLYLTGWTLEATDDVRAATWDTVSTGILEADGQFKFTVSVTDKRFFRLRRPAAP